MLDRRMLGATAYRRIDDGKSYMSHEQAVWWYTFVRINSFVLAIFAVASGLIIVYSAYTMNKGFKSMFNSNVSGMIFFLLMVDNFYAITCIPYCGSRESNPNYPVCRSTQMSTNWVFDFSIALMTNAITFIVAYALYTGRSMPVSSLKLGICVAVPSITLALLNFLWEQEKEFMISNGGSIDHHYRADTILQVISYVRITSVFANLVGALLITRKLWMMNYIKLHRPNFLRKRSNTMNVNNTHTKKQRNRAAAADYPLFRLASRLILYPVVQALCKLPAITYHMAYHSTSSNYVRTVVRNSNYIGQTIHCYTNVVFLPLTSILFNAVFLYVQPGAWTEFKRIFNMLLCALSCNVFDNFCTGKGRSAGTGKEGGIEMQNSLPHKTNSMRDLSMMSIDDDRFSDIEMTDRELYKDEEAIGAGIGDDRFTRFGNSPDDWEQSRGVSFHYDGDEIETLDWKQKRQDETVEEEAEDTQKRWWKTGGDLQDQIQSIREASHNSEDFVAAISNSDATGRKSFRLDVVDELGLDELLSVVDAQADEQQNLEERSGETGTTNPIQANV